MQRPAGRARRVLVLNAGSSSLKAALIQTPERTLGRAEVDWGADASRAGDRSTGLEHALGGVGLATEDDRGDLDAVGYRVVHGGTRFREAAPIDDEVVAGIREVARLAPLHNGVALETIQAGRRLLPGVPHVACFDTAFHATLEPAAYRYPVPESWFTHWGVRRFGFHGLSVEWSVGRAAALLGRSVGELCVVVAHLGSGCSVTAVHGGRSVETSMGLTPLEGLMMGTRSGSVDPGISPYLVEQGRLTAASVAEALDHGSGLLGVSGATSDMRRLLSAADSGDQRAALAIDMFERRAAAGIAAVATALPRLDALVLTGGIGQNAWPVQRGIVGRLGTLGVSPLGQGPVTAGDGRLDDESAIAVLRIEAREDLVIAHQVASLLS